MLKRTGACPLSLQPLTSYEKARSGRGEEGN